MFAHVIHQEVETEVCCRKITVMLHAVEVYDGAHWWQFSISPRVTTPWRIAVTCAAAVRYVKEKMK